MKTIGTTSTLGDSFTGNCITKSLGSLHEFYISGLIDASEEYTTWFDTIRNANQNDVIKIHINSYGGDLFCAIQFMRVLAETEARVICSVEGACMSAATMIFLCGDEIEVTPHSVFMFHNYSGGTIGKGGEMIDQLLHEQKWSSKLLTETYTDFLTAEEIQSMLNNKDIWMDSDEVIIRVNNMITARDAAVQAALEPVKPVKPKKPAKPKA